MVMVSPRVEPKACWEFEGEILVLHHPTTISPKYQAMGKFTVAYQEFGDEGTPTVKVRALTYYFRKFPSKNA